MKNDSDIIRTYPSKGLIIFLVVVIVASAGISVGTYFLLKDSLALQIILWIMCVIFFVLSIIVLLKEAIVYVSLDETKEELTIHTFPLKKRYPLNEITKVENTDGYYVFRKGKQEIYRVGTNVTNINSLIVYLERWGINIKW